MTTTNEIAPDLFRLSLYVPDFDMQFNCQGDQLLTGLAGVIKKTSDRA